MIKNKLSELEKGDEIFVIEYNRLLPDTDRYTELYGEYFSDHTDKYEFVSSSYDIEMIFESQTIVEYWLKDKNGRKDYFWVNKDKIERHSNFQLLTEPIRIKLYTLKPSLWTIDIVKRYEEYEKFRLELFNKDMSILNRIVLEMCGNNL